MSVKITVVGTGYVGLVTGACFAAIGHDVTCVDKDANKIKTLETGGVPIYEPGLAELVAEQVTAGRLRFSVEVGPSMNGRDAVFMAVGTPSDGTGERADLRFVFGAATEIAENLVGETVVVTKSTVPVGTNRRVADLLAQHSQPGVEFAIASNPEFLREGQAIGDFMNPDRIVVGAEDQRAFAMLKRIYQPLTAKGHPLLSMGIESAELTKYAANAFLATKLSFINEIADLCEALGAEVDAVATGIGLDRRIGSAFLRTGPGWGGSCFPKDTRALYATAEDNDVELRVVRSSIEANDARKKSMAERVEIACGGTLAGKKVALFGLTFKGQTDDVRESPSLDIAALLVAKGAAVVAYDPSAQKEALRHFPGVAIAQDPLAAVRDADALVIVTDWQEFTSYNLAKLAGAMATPVMIDLRNLFSEDVVRKAGFARYSRVGRPSRDLVSHALGASRANDEPQDQSREKNKTAAMAP